MNCDVLVVGLGPVGAVLAGLIGQTGRTVIGIEPNGDIYPLPRAAHVDHEVMRIFQSLGIAERLAPHVRVAPDYEFRAVNGQALLRVERTGLIGASGWPYAFNLYQPGVERVIRERLAEIESVKTIFGTRFVGIEEPHRDGVAAIVEGKGGASKIHARFIVGCDGAWSPVREACHIALDDYGFDEPWLVLDTVVADETGFPSLNLQLCDPQRPTTFVHMGPGRLRWEFMLRSDEDSDAMRQPESIDALLKPWRAMGDITVERVAVYRFHGLAARNWRVGRVFLAGDAAHQMPPFLGQGLCSGLRDAANLAWKIDLALTHDNLDVLDTYQQERDPHVRSVIERAIEMGRVVCTLDPERAAARDEAMLANPQIGPPRSFPALKGLTLDGTAAAGEIFPQPTDVKEGRLDDVLGAGSWLLHNGNAEAASGGDVRIVDTRRDLPPVLGATLNQWLEGLGVDAVLVRPDRHVFGTGKVDDLLRAWTCDIRVPALS